MTRDLLLDPSHEARLNEVLLSYVEALQAGHALDQGRLLAEHPDLQNELKAFFASHDQVERIVALFRQAACEAAGGGILTRGHEQRVAQVQEQESLRTPDIGQLGDFRLLREVGRGGMGVVYEAEQISLRRRVALKVLPFAAAIDSRQLQRFQNEALAAAHLRHENIVPVYAVGSERGVHYYAMQFVEGESLASLIGELRQNARNDEGRMTNDERMPNTHLPDDQNRNNPLPGVVAQIQTHLRHSTLELLSSLGNRHSSFFQTVADLGRQAALALEHAHERGIVHRDIKPANLLLDMHGQLWVTDFGLAQCSSSTGLTVTGELVGTLRYASPEQALGKRGLVDHRTDIYSLGATLYELVTLRPIFDGRDRHELLRQIADTEPRPPRALGKKIPEELETIILKAVAKEPSDRYATAQELADDLQRFQEDRPIRARRPSAFEKATKWARRHKGAVLSAVLVLLLLVAGMSVTTFLIAQAYESERQERARAEQSFREAREAVDQFAKIGEEELAGNPLLEEPRRRMLATALEYYKKFLEQRRDDPTIRDDLETGRTKAEKILGELTTLMRMDQYTLLQDKDIQGLLHLTANQREAVAQIDALWQTAVDKFIEVKSGPDWERRRLQLAQEQERRIKEMLDPDQRQRFNQIVLQSLGPAAFREPDVIAELKLTAAQCERIRAIEANTVVTFSMWFFARPALPLPADKVARPARPLASEVARTAPPMPPEMAVPVQAGRTVHEVPRRPPRESYEKVRAAALAQIQQDVLTPEQVKRWKEMIGDPVDGRIFAREDHGIIVRKFQRIRDD